VRRQSAPPTLFRFGFAVSDAFLTSETPTVFEALARLPDNFGFDNDDGLSAHTRAPPRSDATTRLHRLSRDARRQLKRLLVVSRTRYDPLVALDLRVFQLGCAAPAPDADDVVLFQSQSPSLRAAVYALCAWYGVLAFKTGDSCIEISRDPSAASDAWPAHALQVELARTH
jgi:hypothetical protein